MVTNIEAVENNPVVKIKTSLGDIKIELYNETPKHRDNFLKLVKEGYYNGTLFHRVISDFMIQGGDGDSKNAPAGKMLGMGDPGYNIDAEFVYPQFFHKRGAIAAARQGDQVNPKKQSSGSQFYIVTGRVYTAAQLDQMEKQLVGRKKQAIFQRIVNEHRAEVLKMRDAKDMAGMNALKQQLIDATEVEAANDSTIGFTPQMREAYTTIGGTPHLDGDYTVYGEVIEGMEVVAAIEKVETDGNDRPKSDVKVISMQVEK